MLKFCLFLIIVFPKECLSQIDINDIFKGESSKCEVRLLGTKWQSKGEFCTDTIEFSKVETCEIYHCELGFSCNGSYYNCSMYGREEVAFAGDTLIITETDDCNPNTENIINELTIVCSKAVVMEDKLTFISTYTIVVSREGKGIINETKPNKMDLIYTKVKP